jgi:hypothetical protein
MALRSAAHVLISRIAPADEGARRALALALIWAGFLTVVVAGPWLLPGFLFGTDWPGPRHFALPTTLDSSTLLQLALAVISWAAGGELTGKLFVLGCLFSAAAFAYFALPEGGFLPRAAAATVYVVNPFVYGRLHYGQLFLIAAYAALPWMLARVRRLLLDPGLRSSLWAAAGLAAVGILSPHALLMSGVLVAALYAARALWPDQRLPYLRRSGPWIILALAVTAAASAYWLIPLVSGRGSEGAIIVGTGVGALSAYAAVPDQSLGLLPNLLGLYGFWAENTGRFTSMKAFVAIWPIVLAVMLLTAGIGAFAAFRRQPSLAFRRQPRVALSKEPRDLGPWVAGLLVAAAVALILEMGVSHPLTAGLVGWLDVHFSPYKGMRDAGKWAAILALVYSQLIGLGGAAILRWLATRLPNPRGAEWVEAVAAGLLLAVPLYFGNGLLFGAHGEIKPSQYPAGWYAADRVLAADHEAGRVLFLPWHEYMPYSFVLNQNRVIASPAPSFFSVPIVVSQDPEVPGVAPPQSRDQDAITGLVKAGSGGQWAQVLAADNIKYVLVARELDWASFAYLRNQPGLAEVGDFGSIILYRDSFYLARDQ